MNRQRTSLALAVAFVATVYGANWALDTFGFVDLVGPGVVMVPAGVYFAGFAFGIRDALHEVGGRAWVLGSIAAGAGLAWTVEPNFAVASGAAFGLAELADYGVYAPLRRRNWAAAVVASNIVGAVVDSLLFLSIAFSTTAGWLELTYGKALMIAPSVAVVWLARRRPTRPVVRLTDKVLGDS